MSFSFQLKAKTKDEIRTQAADKLKEIVSQQPIHVKDSGAVQGVIDSYLGLVDEPGDDKALIVSVSGYVSFNAGNTDQTQISLVGANINVSVSFTAL